jgi:hypothetical protein
MDKIKQAQFPTTKKELRSFIGLVNSVRRVIPFDVIKEVQKLTPLTSASKLVNFLPKESHFKAFENIKNMLLQEPLFCNLIHPQAVKYLWVDAASSSGCLGAVLAQRIDPDDKAKILPLNIDLENPVQRIIYDKELPYEPCLIQQNLPVVLCKITSTKTTPPIRKHEGKFYGFKPENVDNSLFWSYISVIAVYGCKIPESTSELRKLATKDTKRGILGIKLKDQSFDNVHMKYRTYLQEFEDGKHNVDKDWILIEALAKATYRCIIIISTLSKHKDRPIIKYNPESTKPPIIMGAIEVENKVVFTPYFYNKNLEFNTADLMGKVQIIAYWAKSVPDAYRSRSILDLEAFAILASLYYMQKSYLILKNFLLIFYFT